MAQSSRQDVTFIFCQTEGVTMTPLMSDNKMIQARAAARNVEAGSGDN